MMQEIFSGRQGKSLRVPVFALSASHFILLGHFVNRSSQEYACLCKSAKNMIGFCVLCSQPTRDFVLASDSGETSVCDLQC